MQALYGFFQSENKDLAKTERKMFNGIDKIYDLYIYQLAFLLELKHVASVISEDAKSKHLPTADELNQNSSLLKISF